METGAALVQPPQHLQPRRCLCLRQRLHPDCPGPVPRLASPPVGDQLGNLPVERGDPLVISRRPRGSRFSGVRRERRDSYGPFLDGTSQPLVLSRQRFAAFDEDSPPARQLDFLSLTFRKVTRGRREPRLDRARASRRASTSRLCRAAASRDSLVARSRSRRSVWSLASSAATLSTRSSSPSRASSMSARRLLSASILAAARSRSCVWRRNRSSRAVRRSSCWVSSSRAAVNRARALTGRSQSATSARAASTALAARSAAVSAATSAAFTARVPPGSGRTGVRAGDRGYSATPSPAARRVPESSAAAPARSADRSAAWYWRRFRPGCVPLRRP